jgi:hypothetical protein
MSIWQNGLLMTQQIDKMASRQNDKLMKCRSTKRRSAGQQINETPSFFFNSKICPKKNSEVGIKKTSYDNLTNILKTGGPKLLTTNLRGLNNVHDMAFLCND